MFHTMIYSCLRVHVFDAFIIKTDRFFFRVYYLKSVIELTF